MKFAANGTLYRGSKPVMWSVVEKTALAEAEVEYEDYTSDTVWVKFPLASGPQALAGAAIAIWTTTPWTLPGNRAISYSGRISYGLYEVVDAPLDNWAKVGDRLVLADPLAIDVFRQARVTAYRRLHDVSAGRAARDRLRASAEGARRRLRIRGPAARRRSRHRRHRHRLRAHRAGHGREDFDIWTANARALEARGIATAIPYTVDGDGYFTDHAPGFKGKRVSPTRARRATPTSGDQGLDPGRHADRARPAQTPVSAFLALEKDR
jgi:Isoleucyl-tRNA synthetase